MNVVVFRRVQHSLAVSVLVVLCQACASGPGAPAMSSVPATQSPPSSHDVPSPTPSTQPSATAIEQLADGGTMFPGTYRTKLVPPMTLTIDHLVDLDCAPGYRCRGDIDVNMEHWVALEFGNVHGSELDVARVDKIPATPTGTKLVDPPADLAWWVARQPGVQTVSEPMPVAIGGVPGSRLDLRADKAVSFGPSWGMCPGCRQWITVLRVNDAWVLIVEQLGPDNSVRDFDRVVDGLQPVVDSIVWN